MADIDVLSFAKNVNVNRNSLINKLTESNVNVNSNASLDVVVAKINALPIKTDKVFHEVRFIDADGTIVKKKLVEDGSYVVPPDEIPSYDSQYLTYEHWTSIMGEDNVFGPITGDVDYTPRYRPKNFLSMIQLNITDENYLTVSIKIRKTLKNSVVCTGYWSGRPDVYGCVDPSFDPVGKSPLANISWGDGTVEQIKDTDNVMTHTYSTVGVYDIVLQPQENSLLPTAWYSYSSGSSQYLLTFYEGIFAINKTEMLKMTTKLIFMSAVVISPASETEPYINLSSYIYYSGYGSDRIMPLASVNVNTFLTPVNNIDIYFSTAGTSNRCIVKYPIITPNIHISGIYWTYFTGFDKIMLNDSIYAYDLTRNGSVSLNYSYRMPYKIISYNPAFHRYDYNASSVYYNEKSQIIVAVKEIGTVIGNYAYYHDYYIDDIIIDASITNIKTQAFASSTLRSISIPATCVVDSGAFSLAYYLQNVTVGYNFDSDLWLTSSTMLTIDSLINFCNNFKDNKTTNISRNLKLSSEVLLLTHNNYVKLNDLQIYESCNSNDKDRISIYDVLTNKNWNVA